MRFTKEELDQQGIDLKRWLARAQLACKGEEAPIFKLVGPVELPARMRLRSSKGASTTTRSYSFVGHERFRLGTIFAESAVNRDAVDVHVTLVPVDMDLVAEMSGVSLPLAQAFEHMEGIESWVMNMANVPTSASRLETAVRSAMTDRAAPPQEIEELRGSW